jgi:hypothetical protein
MRTPDDPRPGETASWIAPGCSPGRSTVLERTLAAVERDLDALAALSLLGLSDADVTRLLEAATQALARTTAVATRAVAEADRRRLGDAVGARNAAVWWAGRCRLTRGEAGRLLALGRDLDEERHAPVARALARGEILPDQAGVITQAVDSLPADLPDPAIPALARDHLLAAAADHDARALRILGRRILDVIAPAIAESHEQRLLEREERAAAASARFTMVDDGHGRCHGRFTLPTLHGEMLRTHLLALANPRRGADRTGLEPDELADVARSRPVITPERLGEALMEYVERYPAEGLPHSAGIPTTLTVTMTLEALVTGLGGATLDTGTRISAGEARRLACGAGLVPAVLGTGSEVLDLGRLSRFFTTAQRRALNVRDRGCTALDCGLPPSVCHAHHDDPWASDGRTDLDRGRLLCPRHHRLAHDARYQVSHHPGRKVSFVRRT